MRMSESVTVCILGGGPAGLATALTLRQKDYPVTVIEASQYDSHRVGEHISPECLPYINALGIPSRIFESNSIRCYSVKSIWGDDTLYTRNSIFNVYGEGYLLSRPTFDRELAGFTLSRGVDLRVGCKISSVEFNAGRWLVNYQSRRKSKTLATDFLIDATGKNSQFGIAFGAKRVRLDKLIGIAAFYKQSENNLFEKGSILVEATEVGWWYSTVLQDNTLVTTFMTDGDLFNKTTPLEANMQMFIEQSERTRHILKGCRRVGEPLIVSAVSQLQSKMYGEKCLAVGDAAWSVDPLSAQGILKALRMGLQAAEVVHEVCANNSSHALQEFDHEQKKMFYEYLRLRTEYYRLESRWSDSRFWARRHAPTWLDIPIWIDPAKKVNFHPNPQNSHRLRSVTPLISIELLSAILAESDTVGEAAIKYRNQIAEPVSDKEIIIAIQKLLEPIE